MSDQSGSAKLHLKKQNKFITKSNKNQSGNKSPLTLIWKELVRVQGPKKTRTKYLITLQYIEVGTVVCTCLCTCTPCSLTRWDDSWFAGLGSSWCSPDGLSAVVTWELFCSCLNCWKCALAASDSLIFFTSIRNFLMACQLLWGLVGSSSREWFLLVPGQASQATYKN